MQMHYRSLTYVQIHETFYHHLLTLMLFRMTFFLLRNTKKVDILKNVGLRLTCKNVSHRELQWQVFEFSFFP